MSDTDLQDALKAASAWLERWATHVGNCGGGMVCTCGLTAIRHEAETALAIQSRPTPVSGTDAVEVTQADDLVKRLRFADCKLDGRKLEDHADALCREAADFIQSLSRTEELVKALEQIAYDLIDQQNEPWTEEGGASHNRVHYWRDKAIRNSQAIRAALASHRGEGG